MFAFTGRKSNGKRFLFPDQICKRVKSLPLCGFMLLEDCFIDWTLKNVDNISGQE